MSAANPQSPVNGLAAVIEELEREAARAGSSPALKQSVAYGAARGAAGRPAAEVVSEVLAAVRARGRQFESAERGARWAALGDLAATRAVAGWETQREERREVWLSFLVHDLKNPLNTVVNVAWLLRGRLGQQPEVVKLVGMIERGAQRITNGLNELRELEARSVAGTPPRRTVRPG